VAGHDKHSAPQYGMCARQEKAASILDEESTHSSTLYDSVTQTVIKII